MVSEKKVKYRQAHNELYEIIQHLSIEEQEKIPKSFINNLKSDMDNNYVFHFDIKKAIFEQDLMVETKALLVQVYAKYLAPNSETELWQKYNNVCLNKIEKQKREKYNPNNIFKNINETNQVQPQEMAMVEYKESFFSKVITKLKHIFHIK